MSNINYNTPISTAPLIPGTSNNDTNNINTLKVGTLTDGTATLSNNTITNLVDPTNPLDLATKNYVDTKSAPLLNTVTTISTAGDVALTPAQLIGGTILRESNGSTRTDSLPTAAAIISALGALAIVGYTFTTIIQNLASHITAPDEIVSISYASTDSIFPISGYDPSVDPPFSVSIPINPSSIMVMMFTLTNVTGGSEEIKMTWWNTIYQNQIMTPNPSTDSFRLAGGLLLTNTSVSKTNVTPTITGGGTTYTLGQVINTILNRDTTITGTVDTLPSKETLNIGELQDNDTYTFVLRNIGTETLTVNPNTGVTIDPNSIIDPIGATVLPSVITLKPNEASTISIVYSSSTDAFVAYTIINSGF